MKPKASSQGVWPQVRDSNNYEFVTKLLLKIGPFVPLAQNVSLALQQIAQEHELLGEDASSNVYTVKVWFVPHLPSDGF